MNNPKYTVSVVIAAYNAQNHLTRAIDSILAQTLLPNEIIVVDDGSTDKTKEVVLSYGNKVRYIHQDNAGPGAARNAGIEAAKFEWIAFLDADDEWLKDKLQLQIDSLKRSKDLTWVAGNYNRCLYESIEAVPQSKQEDIDAVMDGNNHFEDFIDAFKHKVFGFTGTMLIMRNILLDTGLFNADYRLAEDIDLWLRIAYKHPRFGYVKEPVAIYHLDTPDSLSRKKQTYDFLCSFINRHLQFSTETGRLESFKLVARQLVTDWMRASLFDEDIKLIRDVLKKFDALLTLRVKNLFYLLTILPQLTMISCQAISKMNRRLKIRRKLLHPTDLITIHRDENI